MCMCQTSRFEFHTFIDICVQLISGKDKFSFYIDKNAYNAYNVTYK